LAANRLDPVPVYLTACVA